MSTKNLIKKENRFSKEYIATVVSNDDPLRRGRLQVTVDTILGTIPFWADSTLLAGSVQFLVIPNPGDKVTIRFKNKDIYSAEWDLKGSATNASNIDPNKYGLRDNQGNSIIIDRSSNSISVTTKAYTATVNDAFVNGNFGTSTGISNTYTLPDGTVLIFTNGILTGGS